MPTVRDYPANNLSSITIGLVLPASVPSFVFSIRNGYSATQIHVISYNDHRHRLPRPEAYPVTSVHQLLEVVPDSPVGLRDRADHSDTGTYWTPESRGY